MRYGAHNQTRTGDLILTKDALYLLSYVGVLHSSTARIGSGTTIKARIYLLERETRLELATFTLEG